MDPLPIYIYYPTANKQYRLNSVSCYVKISDSDFIPLALSTVELSWIELMIDGSWGLAEHGKFGQAILLIFKLRSKLKHSIIWLTHWIIDSQTVSFFHLYSPIFTYIYLYSPIFTFIHLFLLIFTNFHQFSSIFSIFNNFHRFSQIFAHFHQFSPIFTFFLQFSH